MEFFAAYEIMHDEFWITTRDLADFFFQVRLEANPTPLTAQP